MTPPLCLKAILFDFDGTLTRPGALDWSMIKNEIECPLDQTVLEFIQSLPENKQPIAMKKLDDFEHSGAINSQPNDMAEEIVLWFRSQGIPLGIISRNSLKCIRLAFNCFKKIKISDFEFVISRDDPISPKPSPDGILLAADKFGLDPQALLIVGDFVADIQAGKAAGAITVYLNSTRTPLPTNVNSDFQIDKLTDLKEIIRWRLPLSPGKLPNNYLGDFINEMNITDPSVLIPPGVGEDITAVDVKANDTIVLKSDPITFPAKSLADYAVRINANDIATSGAQPKWFLTTLLFPPGSCAFEIRELMLELNALCQGLGISLCGGHTEITEAVTRPVITGMLVGTVDRSKLIRKQDMTQGDCVLLTKGIAVEGTSIIAREFNEKLKSLGMSEREIDISKQYLNQLSILEEAGIAAESKGITAMHDVTEGGLATALAELSQAGKHQIRIEMEKIPILPQTEQICRLLDLYPLGLIGSGSLIICCNKDSCNDLMKRIKTAGIEVNKIGEVMEPGTGIVASLHDRPYPWPQFEVDELTKLYQ